MTHYFMPESQKNDPRWLKTNIEVSSVFYVLHFIWIMKNQNKNFYQIFPSLLFWKYLNLYLFMICTMKCLAFFKIRPKNVTWPRKIILILLSKHLWLRRKMTKFSWMFCFDYHAYKTRFLHYKALNLHNNLFFVQI